MKVRALIAIIIGLVLAFAYHFNAIAYLDAPHNESNHVFCGSCHGISRAGIGTGDFCTDRCHSPQQYCPFTEDSAPLVEKHLDSDENELADCLTCHDPHYQKQKNYNLSDPDDFYIAKGTITSFIYDSGSSESTLTYSSIKYKTGTGWDASKLTGKTQECRRTIMFPNKRNLGYSYPVISVDEGAKTITVKGNVTPVYQYISPPTDFVVLYGQYIKQQIKACSITTNQGCNKDEDCPVGEVCILIGDVKFFDRKWTKSFADGDTIYNGVCEVCHTQTQYHRNDGSGASHYPTVRCTICHLHVDGLGDSDHTGRSGADCEDCHGHDECWNGGSYYGTMQSHSTHTENDSDDIKGPFITCDVCHDTNNYPYFRSGTDSNSDGKYDLSETDVCDNCHSLNGAFDGVNDAVIGAKNNWHDGVYSSSTLKTGKEQWCAGCHDDAPAYSKPSSIEIIDNVEPRASYTGTWNISTNIPGYYGANYHHHTAGSGTDTFTWTLTITTPGTYEVWTRWTNSGADPDTSRANHATYTVYHEGGSTLVEKDQQYSGGTWVSLGTFDFDGTGVEKVELVQSEEGIVIADAIMVTPEIVDNPEGTYTGTWGTSTYAPGYYGSNYRYHEAGSGTDTFTWTLTITTPGTYEVWTRWTNSGADPDTSRANDATYTVYHDGGSTLVVKDQQYSGGTWVSLGTFDFDGTGVEKVELVQSASGYVIADAITWVPPGISIPDMDIGIYAPNVIGDNTTYGFYVTGHKISCLSCHDAIKNHIDHEHRTYRSAYNNYQAGYRLKSIDFAQPMKLPRPWGNPIVNWEDFRLCFSCHDRNEVLGDDFFDVDHTNFWNDNEKKYLDVEQDPPHNLHDHHLQFASLHFDSDWDGTTDSAESCITCHNVHGSTTPVMIRHGELISTYGTTDKVPALDFSYLPLGAELWNSTGGRMNLGGQFVDQNGVCNSCHNGQISYDRTPFIHISALNPKAMPHMVPNGGDEVSRTSTITVSVIYHGTDTLNVNIEDGGEQSMTDEGNGLFSYDVVIPTGMSEGSYAFDITADAGDTPDTGETSATIEVIPYGSIYMNDTDATFSGCWNYATGGSRAYEGDVHSTDAGDGSDTATYTPDIILVGDYNVYAWWPEYTNRADHVPYTINYDGGSDTVYINQQEPGTQWVLLGTYPFALGSSGNVVISDDDDAGYVMADAIWWEPVP